MTTTTPEKALLDDPVVQTLIDQFDARLISASDSTRFWGQLDARVQIGKDEFIRLPAVTFQTTCDKAELERDAIPSMFAHWLAQNQHKAAEIGKAAAQYNSQEFMQAVREHYKFFVAMRAKLTKPKN